MSTTHAHQLVQKLYNDDAFRGRLSSAATAAEKKRIITEAGFGDVTADDLKSLSPNEYGNAEVLNHVAELSDAELESVAGGETATWFAAGIALGILL